MGQAETDDDFRRRVLPLADEADRPAVMAAIGRDLDALGRRYGRFRTGMGLTTDDAPAASSPAFEIDWGQVKTPPFFVEIDVPAWQPPPQTVMSVRYPPSRIADGPVQAFLVVGRMGSDHTLSYLFLGGDPDLAKVEALVRDQPMTFPGDAVVVDLGQSFRSHAEAEARVAEMRRHMPRAVSFFVGNFDPQPAGAAS